MPGGPLLPPQDRPWFSQRPPEAAAALSLQTLPVEPESSQPKGTGMGEEGTEEETRSPGGKVGCCRPTFVSGVPALASPRHLSPGPQVAASCREATPLPSLPQPPQLQKGQVLGGSSPGGGRGSGEGTRSSQRCFVSSGENPPTLGTGTPSATRSIALESICRPVGSSPSSLLSRADRGSWQIKCWRK